MSVEINHRLKLETVNLSVTNSPKFQPPSPTSKEHRGQAFGHGPGPRDQPLRRGPLARGRGGGQGVGSGKDGEGQDAAQGGQEGLEKKTTWKKKKKKFWRFWLEKTKNLGLNMLKNKKRKRCWDIVLSGVMLEGWKDIKVDGVLPPMMCL